MARYLDQSALTRLKCSIHIQSLKTCKLHNQFPQKCLFLNHQQAQNPTHRKSQQPPQRLIIQHHCQGTKAKSFSIHKFSIKPISLVLAKYHIVPDLSLSNIVMIVNTDHKSLCNCRLLATPIK